MLTWAIVLFLLGAVCGLIVLVNVLKGKPSPKPAVFCHGILVAVALIMTIVVASSMGGLTTPIILLIIAALGGFTLFGTDMSKKALPKWLLTLHPIIAVIGVLWLIYHAFTMSGTM